MRKPHLIMLPGWGMETSVFQTIREPLAEIVQLSFVEWRNVRNLGDFKERVKETVYKTNEPVHILGWSLGSIAALEFAAENNEYVKGLILIGATSHFTSVIDHTIGWHPRVIERMKKQLKRNKEKTLSNFYEAMFSQSEKKEFLTFMNSVKHNFQGDDLDSLCTGLDYLVKTDVRESLSKIKANSLLIHGKEDTICPSEASSYMKEQMNKKGKRYVLHNAGHIPFFTRSSECIQLMTQFLQRTDYDD
ncbi:biotin biosynthesis protein BioH [Bacillus sp. AFS001701]|uniref:alpha/beta fold hydrolase n=1 Tax=Bacillaceae TaxID=186817 RepID=UPI000BF95009|nr:alpha/beta fold hydrolase [Bacillus sp. AFS001701]PET71607.1 biotin biosynthesis protein BioH [Bacillus sp. AFS001701]